MLKKLAAHETEGEKVQAQLDEYGAGLWEGPVALDVYIDSKVYTCPFDEWGAESSAGPRCEGRANRETSACMSLPPPPGMDSPPPPLQRAPAPLPAPPGPSRGASSRTRTTRSSCPPAARTRCVTRGRTSAPRLARGHALAPREARLGLLLQTAAPDRECHRDRDCCNGTARVCVALSECHTNNKPQCRPAPCRDSRLH